MDETLICTSHPVTAFGAETTDLLSSIAGRRVVATGPTPDATTLEEIVDAIEAERRSLGSGPWIFWGMSGGSLLGQLYAHRYPDALTGLVLGSAGPYFRPTVEDEACILCPRHPAWREKLAAAGLLEGPYDSGPTEWLVVEGVGWVFRRREGAALLVSPEEASADLQRMMPALWTFDTREWLGAIHLPVLVMCGTADPIVPLPHAQVLADELPNAVFEPISGAGHVPVTERRNQVEQAVRTYLAGLG